MHARHVKNQHKKSKWDFFNALNAKRWFKSL